MRIIKAINKQEQGQILILLVLIIFVFSNIVMIPLLDFMATGIVTTKNTGLHTQEIYAAEAGVRDAIWKIQKVVPGVPKQGCDPPMYYAISGDVNDKSVNVTITWIDTITYRIHSLATNPKTGHFISIDSDLEFGATGGIDLSSFAEKALTSPGTITVKKSDEINGPIWVEDVDDFICPPGYPVPPLTIEPITDWPTVTELENFFLYQVDESNPYTASTINIANPSQRGPLYVYTAGYPNKNYTMTGTGTLNGVIYVVGNLDLDNNADVSLNGYTIFVTGSVTTSPQSSITGPGAIIALGNIQFQPGVSPSYIFIMSVSGTVTLQPQGNFYGAISGNASINMQPGCTVNWLSPGIGNLCVPGFFNPVSSIKTWAIR